MKRFLLILAWTLKSSVLLFVGYYFIKRSRKLVLVDDERKLRKLQYWVWGVIGLAYIALLIYFLTTIINHLRQWSSIM